MNKPAPTKLPMGSAAVRGRITARLLGRLAATNRPSAELRAEATAWYAHLEQIHAVYPDGKLADLEPDDSTAREITDRRLRPVVDWPRADGEPPVVTIVATDNLLHLLGSAQHSDPNTALMLAVAQSRGNS